MTDPCQDGRFNLGPELGSADGEPTGSALCYDPARLTTHGVIVGMTGSGKTGLGVILIEEAMRQGIPTLVLDPKGDMTNLALRFPQLRPADFEPWVAPDEARRESLSPAEYAERQADQWRAGLASSGLGGGDIAALVETVGVTIYTPGSGAGVPLNIIGSLKAPDLDPVVNAEIIADEVQGFVSGLLRLSGIDADPIASREHILLSNLVLHAWRQQQDLSIGELISWVQQPPLRKLGVFDLDSFFPAGDRTKLALRLNGLLASPAFVAWLQGQPLSIETLLADAGGKPQCAVVTMAHLSEEERQFVVTLILGKLVSWMQSQPGTSQLRALVYMDEIFGFAPPTAQPPSKKPILTLLKQARAFGVGLVLGTQNPVDLDYKAISNAGTWFIGRLQTERDRARLLDGLSTNAEMDRAALNNLVAGLDKRQFLLHRAGQLPSLFTTRWAMSYLRGPLTRSEIQRLDGVAGVTTRIDDASAGPSAGDGDRGPTAGAPADGASAGDGDRGPAAGATVGGAATATAATARALGPNESAQAPMVARDVRVAWLDPGAPWADAVDAIAGGTRFKAALAVLVRLRFSERYSGVDHAVDWEAVWFPLSEPFDPREAIRVDHDPRDFGATAPAGATYIVPAAPIGQATFFTAASRAIADDLYRAESIEIFKNAALKLYSRLDESEEDFLRRTDEVAQALADEQSAMLRDKYEAQARRLQEQLRTAERRMSELDQEVASRGRDEWLSVGADVLGTFLGGRASTRSIAGGVRRASSRRRMTSSAAARLDTAAEKADHIRDEIGLVEEKLGDELRAIDEQWSAKAQNIETMSIGLKKKDIHVEDMTLVWIPTSR